MKPYYNEDGIMIYHGDCREILPQLDKVDMVITDPPYNAGKNYGENTNDRKEWPDWCEWFDEVLLLCTQRSKHGMLSFLSQTAYRQYIRLGKYEMAWSMAWVKPLSMAACAAPWMPHWEPIAYWGNKRWHKGEGRWGSDVITVNVEFGKERWDHPTPKPYRLMERLICQLEDCTSLLDPFMGSGTTLVAAKNLGRRSVGIEIEEKYCEIAVKRLAQRVLLV